MEQRGRYVIALLVLMQGIVAAGCESNASAGSGKVPEASFRADPSRMTAEEKRNFDRLTGRSNGPAKETAAPPSPAAPK